MVSGTAGLRTALAGEYGAWVGHRVAAVGGAEVRLPGRAGVCREELGGRVPAAVVLGERRMMAVSLTFSFPFEDCLRSVQFTRTQHAAEAETTSAEPFLQEP